MTPSAAHGSADPPATGPGATIDVLGALDHHATLAVRALAAAAEAADGVEALSEAVLLRLRHPERHATHLLARNRSGEVLGYVSLAPGRGKPPTDLVAEAVVHPRHRRRGIGTSLLEQAIDVANGPPRWPTFRAWAHGDLPAAAAVAQRLGLRRDRILLQMQWPVGDLPKVSEPPGITIRTFRPGEDDVGWVALNATAFAGHPEQAYVDLDDLHDRMAEEWFDPAGFFLAERESDGQLVGFHWTKVHSQPEPTGEVYVIGTDPSARRTGLGLALLVAGLEHLVSLGLPTVMLFTDETNSGAVRMYERLGFHSEHIDVEYAREIAR